MTYITSEAVAKVADLARINSNPDQQFLEKFSRELDAILGYVEELKSAKSIMQLRSSRFRTISQLRTDIPEQDQQRKENLRQAIIAQFPHSQGDLLILSGIFNDY